ncbi:MAG TPA: peptide deformylase [Clostridia bacterium]|jgi:peptide deformylase|nr:peptide deformylase [Clostridia bacterium]
MAIYQIVEIGDDVLRQKAIKIREITPQVIKLLDNLRDTLKDSEVGVGLAAPQIGISKCAIVVDFEQYYELLNPEIVASEGTEVDSEGCLSVPGVVGDVERAFQVTVVGLNRGGEKVVIEAKGLLARIFQHEIDHLNGILFVDRAKNIEVVE